MSTNADLVTAIVNQDWQNAYNISLELAAEAAAKVDKSVGDLSLSLSQQNQQYLALANQMRQRLAAVAVPFAGGISIADKDTRAADSDRVAPAFTRSLHEHDGLVEDDD